MKKKIKILDILHKLNQLEAIMSLLMAKTGRFFCYATSA